LQASLGEGRWLVGGPADVSLVAAMERHGVLPLPPYIRDYTGDQDQYQTVYAAHLGSAAAPTAGLHFTSDMLKVLKDQGVGIANVTLHVGLDTFHPIRQEVVEDHPIHRETYSVTGDNLRLLLATKKSGGRLVAVGTTATRVLETMATQGLFERRSSDTAGGQGIGGETQVFITPGYRFGAVDALLTNFHLPRSTVLALVMAFAGVDQLRAAYQEAIDLRYRFFSFGDAMLLDGQHARADGKGSR
jgi:S-adenosylmethionine:tRNA ribosyltransferase-isomerase